MKLFLIIDEHHFYHPDFVAGMLRDTVDEVVGAVLVTKVMPKNDITRYLARHVYYLRPVEITKLVLQNATAIVKDRFASSNRQGPFYSVRSVFETFGVDYFEAENSINRREYLDRIRDASPDVIVSSNSLIFGRELLEIPSICCLNRHSALLPAYGGLWPVFQAYRRGETYTGVSVHTMVRGIDKGVTLAHEKIPIRPGDTLADLYIQCFQASSGVVLRALDKVRAGDFSEDAGASEASYFSFPTRSDWAEFRERGGRFI